MHHARCVVIVCILKEKKEEEEKTIGLLLKVATIAAIATAHTQTHIQK